MPGVGAPALVVQRVAALEDHAVDAAGAAQHLPAGVVDPAPVHVRLGLRLVLPVVEAAPDRERQRRRHVDEDVPEVVGAARLQHQHAVRGVGGQAVRQGAAGRAAADDHEVVPVAASWPVILPDPGRPLHDARCPVATATLRARPAFAPLWPPDVRRGGSDRPVTEATVSCRNVWKVYGPNADRIVGSPDASLSRQELLEKTGCVAAVRDVSFDVAEGEVFVVMGLSGSGKSTLVRMINRLHDPTAGQVLIDGEDVAEARRRAAPRDPPPEDQHGVPALRPVPAPADRRERGVRPGGAGDREGRAQREGERGPRRRSGSAAGGTRTPTSSRAACSSASGWRGRWRPTPRSCCSTSRSARSTR